MTLCVQDVWWLLHDGGILILVAYLLQRHVVWRRCPLRLFTVVQVQRHIHASAPFFLVLSILCSILSSLLAQTGNQCSQGSKRSLGISS